MAAGPLVLLSAQHPPCDATLLALLTPGPTAHRLGFRTHPGPCTQSHLSSAAPDDCQQLAGPKAQLQFLSWGRGLGCSSSQGGHSSCSSFQAPRRPWDNQAGTRREKLTPGQEKEPHGGALFRAKEPATNVRGKHRPLHLRPPRTGTGCSGGVGSRPAPGQLQARAQRRSPAPRRVRQELKRQQQGRGVRGRATAFPSVSRTGARQWRWESGHHGCLYYPPSNSNFFPSLLANYPASVLISFYYWN